MITLAVDTCLACCSVALAEGDVLLSALSEPIGRGHAERIAPMAREATAQAGIALQSVERIVATCGPGSFTGVRVGLAFARGLSLALNVPCLGVSTLEALTLPAGAGPVGVAIDSADGVSIAAYHDGRTLLAPIWTTAEEAVAAFARLGAERILGPASIRTEFRDAPDIGALALHAAALRPSIYPPAPLYLRPPDAKPPAP